MKEQRCQRLQINAVLLIWRDHLPERVRYLSVHRQLTTKATMTGLPPKQVVSKLPVGLVSPKLPIMPLTRPCTISIHCLVYQIGL